MSFLLWLYLSDSHKENLQKKNAKQNPTQLKNIAHAHSTSTSRVHSRVEQSHMFRMHFTVIIRDSHVQTVTSPLSLINPIDIHYR